MSWGRFEDGVSINPKLAELNDRERRILGDALWAYCARERNGGHFDVKELRHAFYLAGHKTYRCTTRHLHRFVETGLVDDLGNGQYKVHNWERYQPQDPTASERKRRQRAKQQRDSHDSDQRDSHNRDDRDLARTRPVPSRPVTTSVSQERAPQTATDGLPETSDLEPIEGTAVALLQRLAAQAEGGTL